MYDPGAPAAQTDPAGRFTDEQNQRNALMLREKTELNQASGEVQASFAINSVPTPAPAARPSADVVPAPGVSRPQLR